MYRRLIVTISLTTMALHAQIPQVVDLPNGCPYLGYFTSFSVPSLEEFDPHGQPMAVPWWGAGTLQAFTQQHYFANLPMPTPWSFAVGRGAGTGHWRFQTADPFPEAMLQAGTGSSNMTIAAPSEFHLLQLHLDVWLATVDFGCENSSRFVARSHPTGRIQHLVQLAAAASADLTYDARMETVFDELPGANTAWRVRNDAGAGLGATFETGTITTSPTGPTASQGGYAVNWGTISAPNGPPNGTIFSPLLPKADERRSTELHALHLATVSTQAMVQTGSNGTEDFATVHFGLFECNARARTCWGGAPYHFAPEPRPIVPLKHRPLIDRQTPSRATTNHPGRIRLNCADLDGFRTNF